MHAVSEPNITFTHCSVIVSRHTEFCPDIAEFCLVKYFSASLIMHIHSVCAVPLPLFGARARNCAYGKILRDYILVYAHPFVPRLLPPFLKLLRGRREEPGNGAS